MRILSLPAIGHVALLHQIQICSMRVRLGEVQHAEVPLDVVTVTRVGDVRAKVLERLGVQLATRPLRKLDLSWGGPRKASTVRAADVRAQDAGGQAVSVVVGLAAVRDEEELEFFPSAAPRDAV
eukprot:scaffold46193_cov72-Phaeocystis_antarctica.AAC.1